jgi:hypothetical protein
LYLLTRCCRFERSTIWAALEPRQTPIRSGLSNGLGKRSGFSTITSRSARCSRITSTGCARTATRRPSIICRTMASTATTSLGLKYADHWDRRASRLSLRSRTRARAPHPCGLRPFAGLARRCGSTQQQRNPGARRWASITRRKTKHAMLVSVLIMIGRRMLRTRSV